MCFVTSASICPVLWVPTQPMKDHWLPKTYDEAPISPISKADVLKWAGPKPYLCFEMDVEAWQAHPLSRRPVSLSAPFSRSVVMQDNPSVL